MTGAGPHIDRFGPGYRVKANANITSPDRSISRSLEDFLHLQDHLTAQVPKARSASSEQLIGAVGGVSASYDEAGRRSPVVAFSDLPPRRIKAQATEHRNGTGVESPFPLDFGVRPRRQDPLPVTSCSRACCGQEGCDYTTAVLPERRSASE